MSLVIATLLVVYAIHADAQENLGDLISEYGYDWIIGKWAATDDDGRKYILGYKWVLDKHALAVDVKTGDFKYHGMIMFVPSREEIVQIGADNKVGTWKGSWDEDYEGTVNRTECLKADGTTEKMERVYIKIDNNSFKLKTYAIEESGYRSSQPSRELTFKRRKVEHPKGTKEAAKKQKPKKDD